MAGEPERISSVERVVFFSDAVMAIAITLLAIDLRLPDVNLKSDADFVTALASIGPRYFAFVISFAVIGAYWLAHHRMFRYIVRIDGTLLLLNLAFLFFVAQLPFLNSMLGQHGDLVLPTVIYAVALSLMGLTSTLLWLYALRAHLVATQVTPAIARYATWRGLIMPVIFLASIPIALVAPSIVEALWAVATIAQSILARHLGIVVDQP